MTETTLEAGAEVALDTTELVDAVVEPVEGAETEKGQEPAATAETLADGSEVEPEEPPRGEWPEDWRDKMAGGDEKLLKRLSRFASPITAMKAGLASMDKIRSGEMKAPLPEDATDEQKAEWRESNGIPAKVDDYKLPDVKGYEWSDEDQGLAKSFFERVHGKNYTQEQAAEALTWYTDLMAESHQKQFDADTQAKTTLEDDLRLEMGPEYRGNVKMLARFTEKIPGVGSDILAARLPDGSRLGDNKEFVLDMIERARDHYGDSSFVAGDGGSTVANRKAEIEKIMATDIQKYRSEGMDKEYNKILQAEERMGR